MKVLQTKQLQAMDEEAKQFAIPGVLLMDHAAMALKRHIDIYAKTKDIKHIKIVCGSGNNGGDGFALARLLEVETTYEVEILCAHKIESLTSDAQVFANIVKNLGIPWYHKQDVKEVVEKLHEADILVDCLFGTGLNRRIDGWNEILIDLINHTPSAYVLTADIASGIEADTGAILGTAIHADASVAFVAGVLGQYVMPGSAYSGKIEIADIRMPANIYEKASFIELLDNQVIKQMLIKRNPQGHKGTFGKALVIGGSVGMSGAAVMVAQGALRCGIGTLTVMAPEASIPLLAPVCCEMMCKKIPMKGDILDQEALKKCIQQYDVIAFGNGMGRSPLTNMILNVLWESDRSCIFDGDALFYLKEFKGKNRNAQTILTPHPKEVSYLLEITTGEYGKNLSECLKTMKKAYPGYAVVMKNANTLIFDQKRMYLNTHGNDGLATGGSGDVLCGMILGFLAQQSDALKAACIAVYLHACCAEDLAKHMPTASILPRDLLEQIPKTLFTWVK